MRRRTAAGLASILLVALLARLALLDVTLVNSDDGMWLYDAYQMTRGRTPIVDFPSRSPLFHELLAVTTIEPFGRSIIAARGFMITTTLLAGIATFALGRHLAGDRVGLAASALYLVSGISLTHGLHIKTEPLASTLVVCAILSVLVARRDDRNLGILYPLAGVLLAGGLFIRMSTIVPLGAIGIYLLAKRDLRGAVGVGAGWIVLTPLIYLAYAGWSPDLAMRTANQHVVDLFQSRGFGGVQYVGFEGLAGHVDSTTYAGRFLASATAFEEIVVGSIVILALVLVWPTAWCRERGLRALPAYLLGWVAIIVAGFNVIHGDVYGIAGAIVIAAVAYLLTTLDLPSFDAFDVRGVGLVWWVLGVMVAAYLLRNRIIYAHYPLDVLPLAAVLAGIAAVRVYDHDRDVLRRVGAAVLVLLVLSAVLMHPVLGGLGGSYYTPGDVERFGDHVDERTDPGDRVLAAQPLYVIESDADLSAALSRGYYIIRETPPDLPASERFASQYTDAVCEAELAVVDVNMQHIIEEAPGLMPAIERCHTPIDGPDGTRYDTEFYEHR